MRRLTVLATALLVAVFALLGCGTQPVGSGWITLIDGTTGLDNWNRIGEANWRAEDGAIVADKGKGGYLVSKDSYRNFIIYAEFWAATDTNSGVFLRASDAKKIGADSAYEVNIWDIRPDPTYGTGAIVNIARVPVPIVHKAGGKWNTYLIYANGDQLTVKLNDIVTVSTQNNKLSSGPVALQYGAGVKNAMGGPIKWRKVMIKPL